MDQTFLSDSALGHVTSELALSGLYRRCRKSDKADSKSVSWGGWVDPAASAAYGSRCIFTGNRVDFLPDRHSGIVSFDDNQTSVDNLNKWLTNDGGQDGWGWTIRKLCMLIEAGRGKAGGVTLYNDDADEVYLRHKRFTLMATPNQSHGYLYVRAWVVATEEQAPLTDEIVDLYCGHVLDGEGLEDNRQALRMEIVCKNREGEITRVRHAVPQFTMNPRLNGGSGRRLAMAGPVEWLNE